MLGLTPDAWGAIGTAAGVLGTAAAAVSNRIQAADKRAHDLEMRAISEKIETQTKNLATAWAKIDDLRENAVRKVELKEYRAEVKQDMKDLGDRLESAINALRSDLSRDRPGGKE